jgi:hypothetical protein
LLGRRAGARRALRAAAVFLELLAVFRERLAVFVFERADEVFDLLAVFVLERPVVVFFALLRLAAVFVFARLVAVFFRELPPRFACVRFLATSTSLFALSSRYACPHAGREKRSAR